MAIATYIIDRTSDRAIVEVFEAIRTQWGGEVHFQVAGARAGIDTRTPERMEFLQRVVERNSFLVSTGSVNLGSTIIRYWRGTKRAAESPSASLFDQLDVETRDGNPVLADENALAVGDLLLNKFPPIRPESVADVAVSDQGRVSALYSSILERLTEAATKQTEQINTFLREKQSDFDASKKRLDEDYEKRRAIADETARQQQAELDERATKLDEQQKLLDDRDNTHVRREIRRDLNNRINERMGRLTVSARSLFREMPVHLGFLVITSIAVYILVTQAEMLASIATARPQTTIYTVITEPLFISALIKQTFASVTAIAASVYYVRWLIRQHARYGQLENDLRRYQIDFERASWVVETALEWRRDQHSPFPDPLLAAVSRQLFVPEPHAIEMDQTPADMLASALLGSASKVSLNAGPARFEWTGKQLNKAELPKS